jgi:hypothetical protein
MEISLAFAIVVADFEASYFFFDKPRHPDAAMIKQTNKQTLTCSTDAIP